MIKTLQRQERYLKMKQQHNPSDFGEPVEPWGWGADSDIHAFALAHRDAAMSNLMPSSQNSFIYKRSCIINCWSAIEVALVRFYFAEPEEHVIKKERPSASFLTKFASNSLIAIRDAPDNNRWHRLEHLRVLRSSFLHTNEEVRLAYSQIYKMSAESILDDAAEILAILQTATKGAGGGIWAYWLTGWNLIGNGDNVCEFFDSFNQHFHAHFIYDYWCEAPFPYKIHGNADAGIYSDWRKIRPIRAYLRSLPVHTSPFPSSSPYSGRVSRVWWDQLALQEGVPPSLIRK